MIKKMTSLVLLGVLALGWLAYVSWSDSSVKMVKVASIESQLVDARASLVELKSHTIYSSSNSIGDVYKRVSEELYQAKTMSSSSLEYSIDYLPVVKSKGRRSKARKSKGVSSKSKIFPGLSSILVKLTSSDFASIRFAKISMLRLVQGFEGSSLIIKSLSIDEKGYSVEYEIFNNFEPI